MPRLSAIATGGGGCFIVRVRVRIIGTIIGRVMAVTMAMMPRTTSISISVNALFIVVKAS